MFCKHDQEQVRPSIDFFSFDVETKIVGEYDEQKQLIQTLISYPIEQGWSLHNPNQG